MIHKIILSNASSGTMIIGSDLMHLDESHGIHLSGLITANRLYFSEYIHQDFSEGFKIQSEKIIIVSHVIKNIDTNIILILDKADKSFLKEYIIKAKSIMKLSENTFKNFNGKLNSFGLVKNELDKLVQSSKFNVKQELSEYFNHKILESHSSILFVKTPHPKSSA